MNTHAPVWVGDYFGKQFARRGFIRRRFATLLLGSFGVIFAGACIVRLFSLQVLYGGMYRARADENRFYTRYLVPSRGVLLDRNGVPLVRNIPVYKKATEETKDTLHPAFEEIEKDTALEALERGESNVLVEQEREYTFGPALSSVLGYTGEVTQDELRENAEYYLGENIGKTGLEKTQQEKLAGMVGKEILETNAQGIVLRVISRNEPVSGTDLSLTVDAEFSMRAYELLEGKKGSVVASNPQTGEVYAAVSSPSYDPKNLAEALTNDGLPMLNRTVSGTYPPGSVFKMMTALAALGTEAVTEETEITDEGQIKLGEAVFRNWYFSQYGRTEGNIALVRAIQRSNDIYFYKAAEATGPHAIAETARLFQYGRRTGIELPGEASGTIPDPEWKLEVLGERWYLGDTYHMGIGQGNILVTPLQVNTATAAIANKGIWCRPHLLFGTTASCKDLGIRSENLDLVIEGMKAACAQGGTAFPFFTFTPQVACKTGTAEFGGLDEKGRRKTHAWFTVFAPADDPSIAVTVLLEGTEETRYLEGSSDAAPIAKALLTEWFQSHAVQ